MKYYHSSPQQDSKYNNSEDKHNGNTSHLMPGSYSQRIKGSSDEIGGHLEGSLNDSVFNNRFNNSLEDAFHKGEHHGKKKRENVSQGLESNQPTNHNERSYETYLREEHKFFNGHNLATEVGSHSNRSTNNIPGGNFNNLGYSTARSLHGNSFGSMNRRQLYDSPINAPYSTSAGSGGSGENSASSHGYEDDFPELTTVGSKFNNLRLDTDHIEAQSSGNNISLAGNPINTIAEQNAHEISTMQQLKQALNDQHTVASLSQSNGQHVTLTDQGASRFVSF